MSIGTSRIASEAPWPSHNPRMTFAKPRFLIDEVEAQRLAEKAYAEMAPGHELYGP